MLEVVVEQSSGVTSPAAGASRSAMMRGVSRQLTGSAPSCIARIRLPEVTS
jgi:hypothetical protein